MALSSTSFKKGHTSWRKGKGNPLEGDKFCEFCGKRFHYKRSAYNDPPKTCSKEHRYLLASSSMKGKIYPDTIPYSRDWKRKAQRVIQSLVKKGVLQRQPCQICSSPETEGHHYKGYAKENWLIINWLCRRHHREEHARLRKTGESLLL